MQRDRPPFILLPLVALIAVLPLILKGCSCGHDFDFHILSWMEAARQFRHGDLHPHWAYTPAFNAGEPRFVFYPPISWTIGALLGLVLPWTWTPIVYTWLALTVCGIAMHRLASQFAAPTAALLAATFYTVNPYMLFTAYERTAYAELLAAACIPLLLRAILHPQISIPRIAIPVALLWLTNAPAAVMSCYALALLAVIRLLAANRTKESSAASSAPEQTRCYVALRIAAGTALGLGLAAFFVVPAAYERRYVQIAMAILPGMRIQDNLLFHHTGDILHDQVLHTASILAVLLLGLTVVALVAVTVRLPARAASASSRPNRELVEGEVKEPSHFDPADRPLIPLAVLTLAIALLLTPLTNFVWSHVPELAFLQFPWRLLAILAAALGLAIALALSPLKLSRAPTISLVIAIAAALTYPAYTAFQQPCDDEDTVQARAALFRSNQGTDPTDEYTPTTADNDSLAHANPGFWLSPDPDGKAPANATPGPAPTHLTIAPPTPEFLILDLRDYPSWRITDDQTVVTTREQRDDGLLTIPVPAGPSSISISYAHSTDQTLGWLITAISAAVLLLRRSSIPRRFKSNLDRSKPHRGS